MGLYHGLSGYAGNVTLVIFADDTTSLYFSTGGGVLGAGGHESVRETCKILLGQAQRLLPYCQSGDDGRTCDARGVEFHIRTYGGVFSGHAPLAEIEAQSHPLSALFFSAQDVITQVRLHSDMD
ncbi:MAG TPA: hypothetical protein VG820_01400 [Fimbriimonadaceae bacterium]|nr:hypothetical protein [Fimbriimonadaceae bacterium]